MTLRESPLAKLHVEFGAKMVEFGGWEMPLSYPGGTLAEHMACRRDAAVFDVSHLGTVRAEGPEAFARLQRCLTNDLEKIGPGRAQYTHLLDPDDASVVDDLIVWWTGDEGFNVMPNASNTKEVTLATSGSDVTDQRALIAVQGPNARDRLRNVSSEAAAVGRFRVAEFEWGGVVCTVAGTGYTGEDGVECAVPLAAAESFWTAVLAAGARPAGLGARDTLRLEAGLPLHGHELGPGISPLQAGLGWVVAWGKGDFRGREALERERRDGPPRLLMGLLAKGRQPPRAGNVVLGGDRTLGAVSSGNFSPVLGQGIALAFLSPSTRAGTPVEVESRGHRIEAEVVKTPFVGSHRKAGVAG